MSSDIRFARAYKGAIKDPYVDAEFDRVVGVINALAQQASTQDAEKALDTGATVDTRPNEDGSLPVVTPSQNQWQFLQKWEYAADTAFVDFRDLGAYGEILIIARQITGSAACIRQVLVSTDNGGSFLNTSGDYVDIGTDGVEANGTVLSLHNSANASARSAWGVISLFNKTLYPKLWQMGHPTTNLVSLIPTTSALNAIRVRPHTGNFTGGTIYIFGR